MAFQTTFLWPMSLNHLEAAGAVYRGTDSSQTPRGDLNEMSFNASFRKSSLMLADKHTRPSISSDAAKKLSRSLSAVFCHSEDNQKIVLRLPKGP